MEFNHVSVLLSETVDSLSINPDGIYVDCTLGGGGHSAYLLSKLKGEGKLIGIDQDKDALLAASQKLSEFKDKTIFCHNNFCNIKQVLAELGITEVDGVLADLGVSSYQLDNKERGFSFMSDAPLDMRMNRDQRLTAYEVVNSYSAEKLREILYDYGEEKWAKRIADFISAERKIKPIETTLDLVSVVKRAVPKGARQEGKHPATRTFQAIRIEVNSEIEILKNAIRDFCDVTRRGGRVSVITFHSLEDRIVKNTFAALAKGCDCPPELPVCVCGKKPEVKLITRKPILPTAEEQEMNPRSRSAKLRVVEKI